MMRQRRRQEQQSFEKEGGSTTCTTTPKSDHDDSRTKSSSSVENNQEDSSVAKILTLLSMKKVNLLDTNDISLMLLVLLIVVLCALFFIVLETYKETIIVQQGTAEESTSLFHHHDLQEASRSNREEEVSYNKSEKKCSVYLAPSSLPNNGGMGMFTVQNVSKGQIILPADGPQIPIIDPDDVSEESSVAWVRLFGKYWWESGITNPGLYEAEHAAEYQITCGALPNSHVLLNNLEIGHPAVVPYDDTIMDRMTDPGAGAISNYMGRDSIAAVDISAGDEIFLEYPDEYMDYISEKYKISKREHYNEAGLIMATLFTIYNSTSDINVWKENDIFHSKVEQVQKLLPKSQNDIDRVLSLVKNPRKPHEMTYAIAKELSVERRSVDWIQRNGLCLDNIVPKRSINKRAGQGAFAQRFIAKGNVVTPAPLLQITNRDALRLPAFRKDTTDKWQLLLNYCLGHNDSGLLLCPNTNAILVNHCSDRRPDIHPCSKQNHKDNKPNAEYRWAKWDDNTDKWLGMTIEDMKREEGRGLSLDIVATRDILEGEEVFVDYGASWEEAWDKHVSQWKPPHYESGEKEWVSSKQLNTELEPLDVVTDWNNDAKIESRNNALFTGCFYYDYADHESLWDSFQSGEDWQTMLSSDEILRKYTKDNGADFTVDQSGTYADGDFWPCAVIGRNASKNNNPNEDTYIVRILQSVHYENTTWTEKKLPRIISNYPRSSIRHFYSPYRSDIHLPGVFRHHIELPNHLIPNQWRDRTVPRHDAL